MDPHLLRLSIDNPALPRHRIMRDVEELPRYLEERCRCRLLTIKEL